LFERKAVTGVVSAIDAPSLLVIRDSPVVTLEMATDLRSLTPRVRIARRADVEAAGWYARDP
jgi:hypothetical protein